MKRDLYTAVMRGQQVLDARGPENWRELLNEGLERHNHEHAFCVTWYVYPRASHPSTTALEKLELTDDRPIWLEDDEDKERGNRHLQLLHDHGFWPNATIDERGPWTPTELAQAWKHIINHERVSLPE